MKHCYLIFEEENLFTEKDGGNVSSCSKKKTGENLELAKDDLNSTQKNTNCRTKCGKIGFNHNYNCLLYKRYLNSEINSHKKRSM